MYVFPFPSVSSQQQHQHLEAEKTNRRPFRGMKGSKQGELKICLGEGRLGRENSRNHHHPRAACAELTGATGQTQSPCHPQDIIPGPHDAADAHKKRNKSHFHARSLPSIPRRISSARDRRPSLLCGDAPRPPRPPPPPPGARDSGGSWRRGGRAASRGIQGRVGLQEVSASRCCLNTGSAQRAYLSSSKSERDV